MADAKERRFIQQTIFGNSGVKDAEAIERELVDFENEDLGREFDTEKRRPSAYVKVFEGESIRQPSTLSPPNGPLVEMIQTVWTEERHLLLDREWQPFIAFKNLSYNARYCLARMLLLSSNRWYAINSLEKWKGEVGERGLKPAFEELCTPVKKLASPHSTPARQDEGVLETKLEIIDLTADEDEDTKPDIEALEAQVPVAGTSKLPDRIVGDDPFQTIINSDPNTLNLDVFGEDDTVMTLEQLLDRMTVDQLKQLAKQNKVAPGNKPKKRDYIHSLMKNAKTQTSLGFTPKKGSKGKANLPDKYQQTQLSAFFSVRPGQTASKPPPDGLDRLRKQALDILGKCYRVNFDFYKLVRRVHIIYFRCTEHPSKLMVPALLTRFKKRTYPDYDFKRDPEIWTSRHHLLDYEKALELEALVDEMLETEVVSSSRATGSASAPAAGSSKNTGNRLVTTTATTPISTRTPLKTPTRASKSRSGEAPKKEEHDTESIPDAEEETLPDSVSVKKAKIVAKCLDDWLLHTWKIHVELKYHAGRPPSLQRFECGYVYTRLLRRSLKSLQALKQHERELGIIELLLQQTKWLRGGRWKLYERRAIIQMTHLWKIEGKSKVEVQLEAMEGIKQALEDNDTHLVARPGLVKRIRKLEKTLKVPAEEIVQCEGELRQAETVVVNAKRIHHRASSLKLDDNFNVIGGKENAPALITAFMRQDEIIEVVSEEAEKQNFVRSKAEQKRPSWRRKGKSVWEGRNPHQELTVEDRALQFYQDQGFKGHHAETSVLTMIWVLMNWDIVFANVRGAFETRYQSAPLDIVDDSFYLARKEVFDQRLNEIKEGRAAEYIVRHDTKHRVKDTWVIGVSWKLELPDLVEIVECLGGHALEKISRLFCEDYVGRSSGGPDLIVWNYEKQICKFVEVKGPGDKPSENQKLWFDSLLGAGIQVEICKVEDINDVKTQTPARKGKGKTPATSVPRKRKQSSGKGKSDSGVEDELDYEQLDCNSDDELPQPNGRHKAKRRRKTDIGPSTGSRTHGATPPKNGGC